MAQEKVIIEMRPYSLLRLYVFMADFEAEQRAIPRGKSFIEAFEEFEEQFTMAIDEEDMEAMKAEFRVDQLIGKSR